MQEEVAGKQQSLSRGLKLASEIGVSEEHEKDMEAIIKYMETHRI